MLLPVAWLLWKMELAAKLKQGIEPDENGELKRVFLLVYSSLLIDLDHLLSWPDVYVPDRCSIDAHLLHKWWMTPLYFAGSMWERGQPFFIAVFVHLAMDLIDCWL